MLKIKWNMIPREFTTASVLKACNGNSVIVSADNVCFRYLVESEYDYDGTDLGCIKSSEIEHPTREDWELEQWKQAPEWARYHGQLPANGGWIWANKVPPQSWTDIVMMNENEYVFKFENTHVCFQYGEDWKQSLRKRPETIHSKSLDIAKLDQEKIAEHLREVTDQYRQDVLHVAALFQVHRCERVENTVRSAMAFIAEVDEVLATKAGEK